MSTLNAEILSLTAIPASLPFYGTVVKAGVDYVFVGRDTVRRGAETIAVTGDVYAPTREPIPVGSLVSFDTLETDPHRMDGMRTDAVTQVQEGLVRVGNTMMTREAFLAVIADRERYHERIGVKNIPAEQREKALRNGPLARILDLEAKIDGMTPEAIRGYALSLATDYLRTNFASLEEIGVDFSIADPVDFVAEKAKVDEVQDAYVEQGLEGMIASLAAEYAAFCKARAAFRFLHERNLLHPETILPYRLLVDLTVAAPVMYAWTAGDGEEDSQRLDDPKTSKLVECLARGVGTRRFAWFLQLYNRRYRGLDSLGKQRVTRDVMPPRTLKLLKDGKGVFDYLVVLTPYVDQASREWADEHWLSLIDPYLIGVIEGLPFVFVLDRWSGTGLFPLLPDMVADTMEHLRTHKSLLKKFRSNTFWYWAVDRPTGPQADGMLQANGSERKENTVLEPFADELLAAFDAGTLFDFLRGVDQK